MSQKSENKKHHLPEMERRKYTGKEVDWQKQWSQDVCPPWFGVMRKRVGKEVTSSLRKSELFPGHTCKPLRKNPTTTHTARRRAFHTYPLEEVVLCVPSPAERHLEGRWLGSGGGLVEGDWSMQLSWTLQFCLRPPGHCLCLLLTQPKLPY